MFYNLSEYPFTKLLEDSYPVIKREMEALTLARFEEWHEKHLDTNLWLMYGLYLMGHELKDNCAACPETAKILKKIPDLATAVFSAILPGTHIKPHQGLKKMVLRCHLGLSVPEPEKCALKVNGVERHWQEGRCLIFDDTVTHEAWNHGNKPRVVLLIDFKDKKKNLPFYKKIAFSVVSGIENLKWLLIYYRSKKK